LSNSKPKAKDQSSNKFLQRIAGRKALVPPPTPRPVIGEHPVRTLLRENADAVEAVGFETPGPETPPDRQVAPAAETPRPAGEIRPPRPSDVEPAAPALREVSPAEGTSLPPAEEAGPAPASAVEPAAPGVSVPEKVKPPKIAARPAVPQAKKVGEAPDLAAAEEKVLGIRKKYRLNSGEFALYRELYLMTHAVGKAECSFVVSELVNATGMLERRVRDNLRRLKKNGWLVVVDAYDFENREKARYRVNVDPVI
jgi:hypothetical protein